VLAEGEVIDLDRLNVPVVIGIRVA